MTYWRSERPGTTIARNPLNTEWPGFEAESQPVVRTLEPLGEVPRLKGRPGRWGVTYTERQKPGFGVAVRLIGPVAPHTELVGLYVNQPLGKDVHELVDHVIEAARALIDVTSDVVAEAGQLVTVDDSSRSAEYAEVEALAEARWPDLRWVWRYRRSTYVPDWSAYLSWYRRTALVGDATPVRL